MMTQRMAKEELVELARELLERYYKIEYYAAGDSADYVEYIRELDAFTEMTSKRIDYLASQL